MRCAVTRPSARSAGRRRSRPNSRGSRRAVRSRRSRRTGSTSTPSRCRPSVPLHPAWRRRVGVTAIASHAVKSAFARAASRSSAPRMASPSLAIGGAVPFGFGRQPGRRTTRRPSWPAAGSGTPVPRAAAERRRTFAAATSGARVPPRMAAARRRRGTKRRYSRVGHLVAGDLERGHLRRLRRELVVPAEPSARWPRVARPPRNRQRSRALAAGRLPPMGALRGARFNGCGNRCSR